MGWYKHGMTLRSVLVKQGQTVVVRLKRFPSLRCGSRLNNTKNAAS